MAKIIAIDPGMSKCGLIIADLEQQKVLKAEVINSNYLLGYVQKIYKEENKLEILIGNGTTSKKYIKELRAFFPNLIIAEEKNSTLRMGFGSGYRIVNVFTEDHAALTGARDVFFSENLINITVVA